MTANSVELTAGDLTAVVGDNSADGEHRAGYNGVWSLTSVHQPENLFVPLFAGLNLEHVMDGHDLRAQDRVFEPRRAPMELRRKSETEAELHQPPTPVTKVESWTVFRLAAPHYIDFEFRVRATAPVLNHGFLGLFWASYIRSPEDKTMHFRGKVRPDAVERLWPVWEEERWLEFRPAFQCDRATVCWERDEPRLPYAPQSSPILYTSHSHLCFTQPFYYAVSRGMCFQYMFDRAPGIRFTNGVTGAGECNPAWDWQWIIRPVEIGREYAMRLRVMYKPFQSRDDCVAEYEGWRAACGE